MAQPTTYLPIRLSDNTYQSNKDNYWMSQQGASLALENAFYKPQVKFVVWNGKLFLKENLAISSIIDSSSRFTVSECNGRIVVNSTEQLASSNDCLNLTGESNLSGAPTAQNSVSGSIDLFASNKTITAQNSVSGSIDLYASNASNKTITAQPAPLLDTIMAQPAPLPDTITAQPAPLNPSKTTPLLIHNSEDVIRLLKSKENSCFKVNLDGKYIKFDPNRINMSTFINYLNLYGKQYTVTYENDRMTLKSSPLTSPRVLPVEKDTTPTLTPRTPRVLNVKPL